MKKSISKLKKTAVKSTFNSAADEDSLNEAQKKLNLEFPEKLKELYRFANGFDFIGDWKFFTLTEMLQTMKKLSDTKVCDDYLDKYSWSPFWLPLGMDRGGNLFCINLDPRSEKETDREGFPIDFYEIGEIFIYWQDENRIAAQSSDIEKWIENLTEE